MSQATTWGAPRAAEAPVTPAVYADRVDDALDALLSSNSGAARPSYAVAGTVWKNTTTGQLFEYDGAVDIPLGRKVAVPALATSAGQPGDWAADATHAYFCTASATWLRVAIATW